jgi:phenylacetate-CoA ligase
VRGLFVHPEQIAEVLRRHKSITRARLVVERPAGADEMTLFVELGEPADDLAPIVESVQALTRLRGAVSPVPRGSLPRDGRLIEDRRSLD